MSSHKSEIIQYLLYHDHKKNLCMLLRFKLLVSWNSTGVSLFASLEPYHLSPKAITCGPEKTLAASNECVQLPLVQGAWSLRCRIHKLLGGSCGGSGTFSQSSREAYMKARPRDQLMKTASSCRNMCRKV